MTYNERKMAVKGKGCVSTKVPINAFKAQMDILGHKFVLVVFGEFNEDMQKAWFNDITEVLVENGLQIKG